MRPKKGCDPVDELDDDEAGIGEDSVEPDKKKLIIVPCSSAVFSCFSVLTYRF